MLKLFWQPERVYALGELGLTPSTKVLLTGAIILSQEMEARAKTEDQFYRKEAQIAEAYDRGAALRIARQQRRNKL